MTSIPSNTNLGIERSIVSTGNPTATTLPVARTASTAWLKATLETAVITVAWAPSPVTSLTRATTSSCLPLMITSAPNSLAIANLSSLISTAITLALKTFLAY